MYLLSTNPTQLQIFLLIALFVRKHDSVPTNKSTRVKMLSATKSLMYTSQGNRLDPRELIRGY